MPVVFSTHTVGHAQVDGRRYVRETHTLSAGAPVEVEYLAPAHFVDADCIAVRTARAAQIDVQLAEAEFDALLNDGA